MDSKEFDKLFELWKKEKILRPESAAPDKTKDCLFFTEFEAYTKNGYEALTISQKQHIQSCSYCQKMIVTFKKVAQEENQAIPIYARLAQAFKTLGRLIGEIGMPRLAPVLVPALAGIIVFIIFSNQPLELKNYSLEFAQRDIVTRGLNDTTENIFKIRVITNYDCYAYLFEIKKNKIDFLLEQNVKKKITNIIPEDKEKYIKKEGKLILIVVRKQLQDISLAKKLILKNYANTERDFLSILRGELKRKDIDIRYF